VIGVSGPTSRPPPAASVLSRADGGGRSPQRAIGRGRGLRHHERVLRIAVVGCIGSGKSTAARTLARQLGLEAFHLDRLWWQPGSYRIVGTSTVADHTIDSTEYRRIEEEIASGEAWIIDGDAANKDVRLSRADTVLFLDLPRRTCTWGLLQRHLRKAYDYPDGVRVSWRWVLFLTRWLWTTWPSKRRPALISAIAEYTCDAEVIHLRTRRQVRSFLEGVKKPG